MRLLRTVNISVNKLSVHVRMCFVHWKPGVCLDKKLECNMAFCIERCCGDYHLFRSRKLEKLVYFELLPVLQYSLKDICGKVKIIAKNRYSK